MKVKIISTKTLAKGNKRNCLSPKRYLAKCFTCSYYGGNKKYLPNNKTFIVKPCESRIINLEYDKLIEKKQILHKRIYEINEKIRKHKGGEYNEKNI